MTFPCRSSISTWKGSSRFPRSTYRALYPAILGNCANHEAVRVKSECGRRRTRQQSCPTRRGAKGVFALTRHGSAPQRAGHRRVRFLQSRPVSRQFTHIAVRVRPRTIHRQSPTHFLQQARVSEQGGTAPACQAMTGAAKARSRPY